MMRAFTVGELAAAPLEDLPRRPKGDLPYERRLAMTDPIPIPPFIAKLESDLALGLYDVSLRPVARANLRQDLDQLRVAAGRGDKGEVQRLVHLMLAAIEHEKGALPREIDELMLVVEPWGEA